MRSNFSTRSRTLPLFKENAEFFKQSGINVLDWHENSPDVNAIENIWGLSSGNFLSTTALEKLCLVKPGVMMHVAS